MRNKKLIIIFSVLCGITLLVIFNSVLFSVQHITPYCYNVSDSALEQEVLKHHNLKKGKSMFFVNEDEISSNIEKNVPNVKVVNIERKFPNRVYINYVKIFEYFRVDSGDTAYFCSNQGKIVRIADKDDTTPIVRIRTKGVFKGGAVGDIFATDVDNDANLVFSIFSALQMLNYQEEVVDLLEFVDVSKNFIYLKTNTGVFIELQTASKMLEKMQLVLSVYDNLSIEQRKTGTLIVSDSSPIKVGYDKADRYEGKT